MRISDWSSDVCSSDLKSTLARLVAGAIACDQCEIRIDGAERSQWDGDALAAHIGYMPQQLSLFAGSIRDNIARFADPDADERIDADVIAAAQLCGAHGMILRLPQGYDTMLGWGGMGLSMGQTRSEEHTSELQSLMRISYAVFCLKKKQ